MADKFLIAPYKSGLRKDTTSWLEPIDSFKRLENVNIKKGSFVKRFGEELIGGEHNTSRVRVKIDTTDGVGAASGKVPGDIFKVGQVFSIGDTTFTVSTTGIPTTLLSTEATESGTYNTSNGDYTFTSPGNLSTDVYWYPAEPIMGITHYEHGPINTHTTYVMDTQFIYKYDGSSFIMDTTFTGQFHGTNSNFFWSCNARSSAFKQGALYITNFQATVPTAGTDDDSIYFYDGSTWENFSVYTIFNSAEDTVQTAKIILSWKGRLFLLSVIEKKKASGIKTAYLNRIRYSYQGLPTAGSAWLQKKAIYGAYKCEGGGYIDLPIEEEITSAAIIKDRLIVYCERSTWEVAYTGSPNIPFVWRGIDTTVGASSTHSVVTFENEVVTVAVDGIYTCNGVEVARIDEQIPEEVHAFLKTTDGIGRINGMRDQHNRLLYWNVLEFSAASTHAYPNKLLVFNYKEKAWSFYDDTITTFGHIEETASKDWTAGSWDSSTSWGTYYQQGDSRFILGGNHQGFLFKINNDYPENAPAMSIANMAIAAGQATLTIPKHNLADGEFINVVGGTAGCGCNGIFKVTLVTEDSIKISGGITGTYAGGGSVARVSKILMQSNDWNPYVKTGERFALDKMEFYVRNTQDGKLTVDYDVDSLGWSFVDAGTASGTAMGTNVLEMHAYDGITIETFKEFLWRTVYFQASGSFVNITLSLSDTQMLDRDISMSPFELQGMVLHTRKEMS